jgi:hypothetical protein
MGGRGTRLCCKKMPRAIGTRSHPSPGAEHPTFESINRLACDCERKEYFDGSWACAPWNWCHSAYKF